MAIASSQSRHYYGDAERVKCRYPPGCRFPRTHPRSPRPRGLHVSAATAATKRVRRRPLRRRARHLRRPAGPAGHHDVARWAAQAGRDSAWERCGGLAQDRGSKGRGRARLVSFRRNISTASPARQAPAAQRATPIRRGRRGEDLAEMAQAAPGAGAVSRRVKRVLRGLLAGRAARC